LKSNSKNKARVMMKSEDGENEVLFLSFDTAQVANSAPLNDSNASEVECTNRKQTRHGYAESRACVECFAGERQLTLQRSQSFPEILCGRQNSRHERPTWRTNCGTISSITMGIYAILGEMVLLLPREMTAPS
jgi:hypothetical protein